MKVYTGIGSRETPQEILPLFTEIASFLCHFGWTLRSGGADGADRAFELGAPKQVEIYLPWKNFNGSHSPLWGVSPEALNIASQFHPAWDRCSTAGKKLHGRNVYQVLGQDLKTPSQFIICWTKNGAGAGGTGQALRIAKAHSIPIFDFGLDKDQQLQNFKDFLHSLPVELK